MRLITFTECETHPDFSLIRRLDLNLNLACAKSMNKPREKDAGDLKATTNLNSISNLELGAQTKEANAAESPGLHNALDSAIAAMQNINRKRKQSPNLGETLSSL